MCKVHDEPAQSNPIDVAAGVHDLDRNTMEKVWSGVMKSTVLTFACLAATLAGTLSASSADMGYITKGNRGDTGLRTSSISAKRERLAASTVTGNAPVLLAQAELPAQTPTAPKKVVVVDESALRYFASKGDKVRLEAEIARLRTLYPEWVPPENPLAIPENADKQLEAMWKLYSQSKYAELRNVIIDRQANEPGWNPPADLTSRLAIAEKRQALIAASAAKNYAEVVTIGSETPSLLTCSDVDVLWRVAEAFAKTDRITRASDAYGYILTNCTKAPERLATVQKASSLLSYTEMESLLALENTLPDGTLEFEPIRDDLARRFVAEGDGDASLTIAAPYLQRLENNVEKHAKASDALLLGWYHIRRKDMGPAERYFRKAYEIEDTASASQGLALTLIARKTPQEAESVMYRWRDTSAEASATYFAATANLLAITPPPVLDADVLGRMASAVTEQKEIKTGEQFGWYALAFHQPKTAAQWFRMTLGWKADYEPSAYGLAVARLQMKDLAGVKQIQKVWAGRSQRIADVTEPRKKKTVVDDIPSPDSAATKGVTRDLDDYETQSILPEEKKSRDLITKGIPQSTKTSARKLSGCNTTLDPETLSPQVAIGRGWCLMGLNRPLEAAAAFEVALRSPSATTREDAAYGQSLAYLRAGLVNDAAVSATKARQGLERAVELQTAILSNRATNAFNNKHFRETIIYLDQLSQLQTERADLMVLRAYAYKSLNRHTDAKRIFEAVAATGNRDAVRALAEMVDEESPR